MPVQMGSQGQAGFEQPIELLMDCHRRIEHFLSVIATVIERYIDRDLDDEARHALEVALHYFDTSAPNHTADEEQSLFPRMRKSNDAKVCEVMASLDALEADHRNAETAHAKIDEIVKRWLTDGILDAIVHTELSTLVTELAATYAKHIKLEDEQVFVLASQVLDHDTLQDVGKEMEQRRK